MANDFKSFSKSNIAIDSGTYSTLYTVPYTEYRSRIYPSGNRYCKYISFSDITVDVQT